MCFFRLVILSASALYLSTTAWSAETVQILTKDGETVEGATSLRSFNVNVKGAPRKIAVNGVLSLHSGDPATPLEAARIQAGMTAIQAYTKEPIQSEVRRNRDSAIEDLTNIGLPVLTPLLQAFQDTDQHEPRPLYRLFNRLIPSEADQPDRQASLLRLANGELLRPAIAPFTIEVAGRRIEWSAIRRIAVRRAAVARNLELHSLRHCTQIEYLDTGILLSPGSSVNARSSGFVRLSWDTDSWASGPDGLRVPGSPAYKSHLVDGHPFGAIVGRIGSSGKVILVGSEFSRADLPAGRLELAVNDNPHWQNNVGNFRIALQATNAYDVGAPQ